MAGTAPVAGSPASLYAGRVSTELELVPVLAIGPVSATQQAPAREPVSEPTLKPAPEPLPERAPASAPVTAPEKA
ncbi:hypothetical protein Micbo1qcDRAFT_164165, partial [Microdochium bolleyi]